MRRCRPPPCVLWDPRLHPEPRVGYASSESQEWLEESDSEEDSSSDEEGAEGEDGDQEEDSAEEGAGESHSQMQGAMLLLPPRGPAWPCLSGAAQQAAVRCSPALIPLTCLSSFSSLSFFLLGREDLQHPEVARGEQYGEYLSRTEQHWLKLARNHVGPDAKEKKVLKVAQAMAKACFDDAVEDIAQAKH